MITDNVKPKNGKEALGYMDKSVSQLDEQRLSGLQEFKTNQQVRDEVMQQEKIRLESKYGAGHPRVQKAESRLVFNQQMVAGLDKEIEKASIKTEPFDSNSWRIHGKVFDRDKKPVQGLTVYFSDQKKIWIKATGTACTNETGYYSLTLDEKTLGTYLKQPLWLSVSDKDKNILFLASVATYASKGSIVYQDIYLYVQDCGTPPPGGGCKPFG
jgi:hypothetical protein